MAKRLLKPGEVVADTVSAEDEALIADINLLVPGNTPATTTASP